MSERERWIIYPLVFFALGAALRDKFTQSVHTEELHAGKIACEELVVLDSDAPNRSVAKLLSAAPAPGGSSARYGVLALYDSEGKEICGVTNNQLAVNSIAIVNPQNQAQPLALLNSLPLPDKPDSRFGSLQLRDSEGHMLLVTPLAAAPPANAQRKQDDAKRLPPERKTNDRKEPKGDAS